jgi:hypothetical protein
MNLFKKVLIRWIFFRKLLLGWETTNSSDRFLRGVKFYRKFLEIIGNYLLGCERTNLFRQVLKEWIFFGNYWKKIVGVRDEKFFRRFLKRCIFFRKLLENIVGVRNDESLQTGSYMVKFFRKFLEIIGKYCWGVKQWISSDRFL